MLRGTIVKINDKAKASHLIGRIGVAVERTKRGRIKVIHQDSEGFHVDIYYAEDNLDIIEPPIEL